MNRSLIVVCGPTATGKTKLGIYLSKKLNGEIISADSRQIYKGMDIGTGKEISNFLPRRQAGKFQISNEIKRQNFQIGFYEINNIPIWLYDVINPNQTFSAYEFAKIARLVIENIEKRGKAPIIVGGTGFYIKALVDGIETEGVKADWKLRKKLRNCEIAKLRKMLKQLDLNRFEQMNNSDRNNPRRLIRAIEIAQNPNYKLRITNYKFPSSIFIGLKTNNKKLYERIDRRVDERIKQGIIKEIKNLLKAGCQWEDPGMSALGYKEWKDWFEGKKSKEEVIQRWKFNEHSYARRQLTWFKKDKRIKWFNIENLNKEGVLKFVKGKLK